MPSPAAAPSGDTASTVLGAFEQLHDRLRREISGLSSDALNWVPADGANSIATIVTHVVGSEEETLRTVAGLPSRRNRDGEFAGRTLCAADVLALVEGADALIRSVHRAIDGDRLEQDLALPTLPASEMRTGLSWLIRNYGHACEHLGHVELTKQLYLQSHPVDSQ